jgi:redox-sensitive bicupin YhaK (pirin superfamily)
MTLQVSQVTPMSRVVTDGDVEYRELAKGILEQVGLPFELEILPHGAHLAIRFRRTGLALITSLFEEAEALLEYRDCGGARFEMHAGDVLVNRPNSLLHCEAQHESHQLPGMRLFESSLQAGDDVMPSLLWLKGDAVRVAVDAGSRVRVLAGEYKGVKSPLIPFEKFVFLEGKWVLPEDFPLREDWATLICVLEGALDIKTGMSTCEVAKYDAVLLRSDQGESIRLAPQAYARAIIVSFELVGDKE